MRVFFKIGHIGPFLRLYGPFEANQPIVDILNLCQKITDKISKDSCQYVHSVHIKGPKCQKTTKMVNFDHIFDVFSVQYN